MKRVLTIAVALAFGLVAFAAQNTSTTMTVNVPFSFTVGKATLPAGEYTVELQRLASGSATGSAIVVRSADDTTFQRVAAIPMAQKDLKAGAVLVFNKYRDAYFLAEVRSYGLASGLARTKAEKEIAASLSHQEQVAVAAE